MLGGVPVIRLALGYVVVGGFTVLRGLFLFSAWLWGGQCPPSCATCTIAELERELDRA